MDSAEHVARQRGYNGFSYADLAREVGIRKASIHHHFPTKADLAMAIIERYRAAVEAHLKSLEEKHVSAAGRLRAYIDMYRVAMSDGKMLCLCVAFSISRASLTEEIMGQIDEFHEDSITWLTANFALGASDGSIKDVLEPAKEAAACLSLVIGGQLMARSTVSAGPFDRAVIQLEERLS